MHWEAGNYAFGAAPQHPFIKAIIENCIRAQVDDKWREQALKSLPRALRSDLYVIYTTGPGLVSRTLAEYDNAAHPIKVLFPLDICDKEQWNRFGDHGVHLMKSSWRTKKGFLHRKFIDFLGSKNEQSAVKTALRSALGRTAPMKSSLV
jgi:hypothetical protein